MDKHVPSHVAVIMDGNGRWAKQRNLTSIHGHKQGTIVAKNIVEHASKLGIKYLTLYTFSSENWLRPEVEVLGIMKLLKYHITNDRDLILKNNIKLRVIGNFDHLSKDLQGVLIDLESETKNNSGMELIIALSYGSREEILSAVKKVLYKIEEKKISIDNITEETFSKYLYTLDIPDPDLLIRTGREVRVSNFLLWQIAYTELYFSTVLWPDFSTSNFDEALEDFKKRERRYGK